MEKLDFQERNKFVLNLQLYSDHKYKKIRTQVSGLKAVGISDVPDVLLDISESGIQL